MNDTFEIPVHTNVCIHRDDIPRSVWEVIVSDINFYLKPDGNIIMCNLAGINTLELNIDLVAIVQEELDDSDYKDPEWKEHIHKRFKLLRDKLNIILGE